MPNPQRPLPDLSSGFSRLDTSPPHRYLPPSMLRLRDTLLRALPALMMFGSLWAATQQGDWTLYKVEGRDYVTMENVADFYGMNAVHRTGEKSFEVRSGSRSLKG